MPDDPYASLASRYDRMIQEDPERLAFFRELTQATRKQFDAVSYSAADLSGDWSGAPYAPESAVRLIAVATV